MVILLGSAGYGALTGTDCAATIQDRYIESCSTILTILTRFVCWNRQMAGQHSNHYLQVYSVLQHQLNEAGCMGEAPAAATIDGISVRGARCGPPGSGTRSDYFRRKVASAFPRASKNQRPEPAHDPDRRPRARGSGRAGDASEQTIKRAALRISRRRRACTRVTSHDVPVPQTQRRVRCAFVTSSAK